jgi:TetR/AcrR family transcriptional regulator, transcriptional repressor for nem operon
VRYAPGHKSSTRRRIVEGAAAALRARGVAGVGVAELMRQAGLTHGGFYSHFASKDALVAEAIEAAAEQSARNLRKVVHRAGGQSGLSAIVDSYLSTDHRDRPDRGCALAALGSELARESPATRRAATTQLERLLDLLAEHVSDRKGTSRRRQAMAVLSCLVGALVLSRAVDDPEASRELLAAARRHLTERTG